LAGGFYLERIVFVLRSRGQNTRFGTIGCLTIPFLEEHDGHKTPYRKGSLPFSKQWGFHQNMVKPVDP